MQDGQLVQLVMHGLEAYQQGRLEEAIKLFNRALDMKKDEWEARLYLGMAYFRCGQRKQAKYHFQAIIDWSKDQELRRMAQVALESFEDEKKKPSGSKYLFGDK